MERDGLVAGLGWYPQRGVRGSRRPAGVKKVRLRFPGGGWTYKKAAWDSALKVLRFFQRDPPEAEIAEVLDAAQRNLARLRDEVFFQDLDGNGGATGRGGMPLGLRDPRIGGRGELPPGWEPLPW